MIQTSEQIQAILDTVGVKGFRGLKFPGEDFSGLDLKNADFRGCSLAMTKFVGCNLTYANFEGANCYGADWTDAILHRTNFKEADLSASIMFPKDLFGCTFTMECKSFQGMKIAPGYWAGWLFYALMMEPPSREHRDKLIQTMGIEYWEVLRTQYASRRW